MSEERNFDVSSEQHRSSGKAPGHLLSAGLVIFLIVGGFVAFMNYQMGSRVKGDITLASPVKSWTMHVNSCSSGERKMFFGVLFSDKKQPAMGGRISMPEDGEPRIILNRPDADYAVAYGKRDCKVWDVDLQRTNSTYNNIWGMTGHARFDCETTDDTASHAVGDVQFGSCH